MVKFNESDLDQVFQALADPTRRQIVETLGTGERTVGELAEPLAMSLPAVSKHLGVLERAGLLHRRRDGRSHHLRVNPSALNPALSWIEMHQKLWEGSFDKLAAHLENQDSQ